MTLPIQFNLSSKQNILSITSQTLNTSTTISVNLVFLLKLR